MITIVAVVVVVFVVAIVAVRLFIETKRGKKWRGKRGRKECTRRAVMHEKEKGRRAIPGDAMARNIASESREVIMSRSMTGKRVSCHPPCHAMPRRAKLRAGL